MNSREATAPLLDATRSLRLRIALFFVLGVTFALLNFMALLGLVQRDQISTDLEHRTHNVALRVRARMESALASGSRQAAWTEARRTLLEDDVVGVAVYDAKGALLARASASAEGAGEPEARLATEPEGRVRVEKRPGPHGDRFVGTAGPAPGSNRGPAAGIGNSPEGTPQGLTLGAVQVVLSSERPLEAFRASRRFGYALLVAILMIGFFASLMLTQIVVHPLHEASKLATEIAAGRFDSRLPVRSRDELGSLAASLNRMASSLQQARTHERTEAEALRTLADAAGVIARETQSCEEPQQAFEIVALQIERASGFGAIALEAPPEPGEHARRLFRHPPAEWDELPQRTAGVHSDVPASTWLSEELSEPCPAIPEDWRRSLASRGFRTVHATTLPWRGEQRALLVVASRESEAVDAVRLRLALELGSQFHPATHAASLRGSLRNAFESLERTQEQLIHSERMRATGEMASGVAHDFNNVLAAILARVQLLRRRQDGGALSAEELAKSLSVMETAARDGAETVRRLRQVNQGEDASGRSRVDLSDVVRDAWEFARLRTASGATELDSRVAAELALIPGAWVEGHPSQLREVFANLILNAQDAMPEGGTIRLSTKRSGSDVVAVVQDSGVGMDPDVRGRIFDLFYTTKGPHGTGLGLSVVYGIVKAHGGTVHVHSTPGTGSTFEISFPATAAADASPGDSATAHPSSRQSLRVMLVDDEDAVRDLLADVVRALGHEPHGFGRADEALAALERESYDLIFTDLGMPGLTGWQFVRLVREKDVVTPVVFVTGWGAEVEPERLREAGADAVIGKPFSIDDIAATLAAATERRVQREAESRAA